MRSRESERLLARRRELDRARVVRRKKLSRYLGDRDPNTREVDEPGPAPNALAQATPATEDTRRYLYWDQPGWSDEILREATRPAQSYWSRGNRQSNERFMYRTTGAVQWDSSADRLRATYTGWRDEQLHGYLAQEQETDTPPSRIELRYDYEIYQPPNSQYHVTFRPPHPLANTSGLRPPLPERRYIMVGANMSEAVELAKKREFEQSARDIFAIHRGKIIKFSGGFYPVVVNDKFIGCDRHRSIILDRTIRGRVIAFIEPQWDAGWYEPMYVVQVTRQHGSALDLTESPPGPFLVDTVVVYPFAFHITDTPGKPGYMKGSMFSSFDEDNLS
jgi:hypothetical protein